MAPRLDTSNLLTVVHILNFLGVPTNAAIFLEMLNLVRHQVNDIPLEEIRSFHFMLSKQQQLPLVEALQLSLPILFQMQLKEMDREGPSLNTLLKHLEYAAHHADAMNIESVKIIVSAVMVQRNKLRVLDAESVIWNLTQFKDVQPSSRRLLYHCIDIAIEEDIGLMKALDLLTALRRIVSISFIFNDDQGIASQIPN